jgi:hypothetical protein
MIIGILRESYNVWERRAPLTPDNVQVLLSSNPGRSRILVQPSRRRVFQDLEYRKSGAVVTESLKLPIAPRIMEYQCWQWTFCRQSSLGKVVNTLDKK